MIYENKIIKTLKPFAMLQEEKKTHNLKNLNFRVMDFQTIGVNIRKKQRKIYSQDELEMFYYDDFYVKTYDHIVQEFTIEIFQSHEKPPFAFLLKVNADKTEVSAKYSFEKQFIYYHTLKQDMLQAIYRSFIKQKMLIIRLDKKLLANLEHFVLETQKGIHINEVEVEVARGVPQTPAVTDNIVFYKQAVSNTEQKPGKYENAVEQDELLFEYTHRQYGRAGRDLQGFIANPESEASFISAPKIKDNSIYQVEKNNKTKYYSAYYGFLLSDEEGYSVKKNILVDQVNLKTGSILADLDKDVTVEVISGDVTDDAVKSCGIDFTANNIKIEGSVAATSIYAESISIKGVTHAKSSISAKQAFVNIHKGHLIAEIAHIKNLEGGSLEAQEAMIERSCSAATIQVECACIKNAIANNKIYPSKLLVLEADFGNDNIIDISHISLAMAGVKSPEHKELLSLIAEMDIKIQSVMQNMEILRSYLVKHQVKFSKYHKGENNSIGNQKFIALYNENLKKHYKLLQFYNNLIHLKFQILMRLKEIDNQSNEIKIYIKTLNCGFNNLIYYTTSADEESRCSYLLSEEDINKMFYLELENNVVQLKHINNTDTLVYEAPDLEDKADIPQ